MAKYTQNEANRFHNLEIWQLHDFEICYFLHAPRDESELPIYKLNIPAIMPNIPVAPAAPPTPVPISKSIFVNSPECSLPVKTMVKISNHICVRKRDNEHFKHRFLDFGVQIYVETVNGDIDEMYVTTRKDPSYCDSCASQHPYYYCQPLEYHCNCC